MTLMEKITSNSIIDAESGCWLWTRSCSTPGYGQFQRDGIIYGAHRAAWEARNGPIPEGMCVLHKCDTRKCVNPDHLFLGTKADNAKDRDAKGRHWYHEGEDHVITRLTKDQISSIRSDMRTQRQIAKDYGVSQGHVSNIKTHKAWRSA